MQNSNIKNKVRYGDLIVVLRIVLVAIFSSIIAYSPTAFSLVLGILIIGFIFFTDTLDGIVARRFDRDSKFGGFVDILGDRITETALLIPFVFLNYASPLILIYFILKNFSIDFIRFKQFYYSGNVPFKQLQNNVYKFLVASRFMRACYGFSKMLMIFLFYTLIFRREEWLDNVATIVSIVTVVLSILRSAPAFIEYFSSDNFLQEEKR